MKDLQALVEYRHDGEWRLLGTFHPGRNEAMANLLGAGKMAHELRGIPEPCSFETWLATMQMQGGRQQLSPSDMASIRIGRIVGGSLSRLVAPSGRPATWFSATEVAHAFRTASAPPATWAALLELMRALPDGRAVVLFS